MPVLKLSNDGDSIDVRHYFKAVIILLEVIEKQKDDSYDFFLTEVVEHLSNSLNDLESGVFETSAGEWMIGYDP
jgi:hypothetical protein